MSRVVSAQAAGAVPVLATRRTRFSRRLRSNEGIIGFLFVLPMIITFLVVRVAPAIWALWLSFTEYSVLESPRWVGLHNYQHLLEDPVFSKALENTVVYTVGVTALSTAISLAVALLLNSSFKGKTLYRTVFFLPVVVAPLAVSTMWAYILNPNNGVLNYLLSLVGISSQNWLSSPTLALPSVIAVTVWSQMSYNIIIFLMGLQAIPPQLYEAAEVDGVKGWLKFRKITLPMLRPTIAVVIVLSTLLTVQSFDFVQALTHGGPANNSTVVVQQIYLNAFKFFKMGYASAMAFALFVLVALLTLAYMAINGRARRPQRVRRVGARRA